MWIIEKYKNQKLARRNDIKENLDELKI